MDKSEKDVLQELLQLCKYVYEKGFVSGSGGNISMRHEDVILITPTGYNLGRLQEHDITRLDLSGNRLDVDRPAPSQEWLMHCNCYRRSEIRCVVHVHSLYATALSCLPRDPACAAPVYTPNYAIKVGNLPVIAYFRPGSVELAEHSGKIIATRNSVLLANHGLLTVGTSADQALSIAEEIEDNAHMFFILNGQGATLTDGQQQELQSSYKS